MAPRYEPISIGGLPKTLFGTAEPFDWNHAVQQKQQIEDNAIILDEKRKKQQISKEMEAAYGKGEPIVLDDYITKARDSALGVGDFETAIKFESMRSKKKDEDELVKNIKDLTAISIHDPDVAAQLGESMGIPQTLIPRARPAKEDKQQIERYYDPRTDQLVAVDEANPRAKTDAIVNGLVKNPSDDYLAERKFMMEAEAEKQRKAREPGFWDGLFGGGSPAQSQPINMQPRRQQGPPPGARVTVIKRN